MKNFGQDLAVIAVSAVFAAGIVGSDVVDTVLSYGPNADLLVSFLAGVFFVSIFTAVPATAVLAGLAESGNLLSVAVLGGLGSVVGDYILFLFLRDRLMRNAGRALPKSIFHRVLVVLQRRQYHRLLQVLGIVFLATPLPDEPALALLGLTSISRGAFFVLSFVTHAAGILAIGLIVLAI